MSHIDPQDRIKMIYTVHPYMTTSKSPFVPHEHIRSFVVWQYHYPRHDDPYFESVARVMYPQKYEGFGETNLEKDVGFVLASPSVWIILVLVIFLLCVSRK